MVRQATAIAIHGTVDPAFEAVRHAFERNFAERREVGAACAVVRRGRLVVDLWGGERDPVRRLPWERDTIVLAYSTTKGFVATAFAVAVSRGWLAYDDAVAQHWPEFAQRGKAAITVRQLLAHQAGLPILETTITRDDLGDLDRLAGALARQAPRWTPGSRHGYHPVTFGWLTAELLRRVDPAHRSLGRFVQDEIVGPLNARFYIGTPASEDAHVAAIVEPGIRELLDVLPHIPLSMVLAALNPRSPYQQALRTIPVSRFGEFNDPEMRREEIPSTNGIGEPRALARLFGELAMGGAALRLSPAVFEELCETPRPPAGGWRDAIMRVDACHRLGFIKPVPRFAFASPSSFAAAGAGGSFAFSDPDRQLGFAYVPNRLGLYLRDDPRERALRMAAIASADRS